MFKKLSYLLTAALSIAAAACAPDMAHAQIINPNPPQVAASAVAGTGLSQAGAVLSVNYGTTAGTAMQGNTSAVPAWHTTNAITSSTNAGPLGMGTLTWSDTNIFGSWQTSANSFAQLVLQNSSNGALASTGYLVSNDVGTATTFYGEFGMNSSGFTGSGSLNLPSATYLTSTSGDLSIGTTTANGIHFLVNNGTTDVFGISSTGIVSGPGLDAYEKTQPQVQTVANVAALNAINCVSGLLYKTGGYRTLNDGGDGIYYCNGADTTTTTNGGTVLAAANSFRYYLQQQGPVDARKFGAYLNGTNDDTTFIAAEITANVPVLFSSGTAKVSTSLTFAQPVTFYQGAQYNVTGGVHTFGAGVIADWYTIFSDTDNFVTTPTANPSIIILGVPVKADWFCAKVMNIANILTIADQTNNLTKAYRAAIGNWVVNGSNFQNGNFASSVILGVGAYRIDGQFNMGTQVSTVYYQVSGVYFGGQGAGSSFLVSTNLSSTQYMFFAAFGTGEVKHIEKFKLTYYNPGSGTPFAGSGAALMFVQGNSFQINNIWASGGEVSTTDANGLLRNGVGFQFESVTDTFAHDLFTEYCVTGFAFSSSLVHANNLETYHTYGQAIGIGDFGAAYPATQTTSSRVYLTGLRSTGAYNYGVTVLENGPVSNFILQDVNADGRDYDASTNNGVDFLYLKSGTALMGSISHGQISNFQESIARINTTSSLGLVSGEFRFSGIQAIGQTYTATGGFIIAPGTGTFQNCVLDNISLSGWAGVVFESAAAGNIISSNVFLSQYVGQFDAGASRGLFVGQGSNIVMERYFRNTSDPVALTQFGFNVSGTALIDIVGLYNAARTVTGSGTTTMHSTTAFL